jgi:adenylate cyclase
MLYLLVLGAGLILLLARIGPLPAAATGGIASLAAFAVAYLGFSARGLLLDPLYPSLAAIAVYLATALALAARMERSRWRVRAAFGRQIADDDVERLAGDASRLEFSGETRDVSVLFCGVRDFAHLADTLDAAALTRFLNRWLTFVSAVVVRHHGTVGRCMGSRLMAFWNAPLDDPDHARHAAQAALEIAAEIERFNRDSANAPAKDGHAPAIAVGLGLNTGPGCVGNLGSALRFDYSVVGSTVDHAERLEEQARAYGVPIVIGETTRARLDGFAVLELDRLHLKSRDRPVRVFALIGAEDAAGETWFRAMAEAQAALLQALRASEAQRAVGLLELCRWAAAGRFGALWDFYAARVAGMRRVSPPDREPLALVRRK